jgi:hypothetical protein
MRFNFFVIRVNPGATQMRNSLRSTLLAVAATAALAIALAAAPAAAQADKGAKATPKPAGPGFCTARINTTLKMGAMYWRTSSGTVLPTLAKCYEPNCPAKC